MKTLVIFDIDDTLFTTDAKIHVTENGHRRYSLTPHELNSFVLEDGHQLDFSDFRCSSKFANTAKPVKNMFRNAKRMMRRMTNTDFIIVTARADLTDRDLFLATFQKHGFPVHRTHVYRAGNLNRPSAEAKRIKIDNILRKTHGQYKQVMMFDDSRSNLKEFESLQEHYSDIRFVSYLVNIHGDAVAHYNHVSRNVKRLNSSLQSSPRKTCNA